MPVAFPPHFTQSSWKAKVLAFSIQFITVDCSQSNGISPLPRKRELFLETEASRLKAEDSMLNLQGKVSPNFYLHFLPIFVNIQPPDFSLIPLPAFLAISSSLFSPCDTSNCLSSSLVLSPPFPPICDLIIIWYHYLSFQGLERAVLLTLGYNCTMHLA